MPREAGYSEGHGQIHLHHPYVEVLAPSSSQQWRDRTFGVPCALPSFPLEGCKVAVPVLHLSRPFA